MYQHPEEIIAKCISAINCDTLNIDKIKLIMVV